MSVRGVAPSLAVWTSGRGTRATALALLLGVVACGGFKQDLAATQRLQSRIQSDLGVPANVNFRTVNGSTTVTIVLASLPAGDAATTKAKVDSLARSEFPKAVGVVIMAQL